MSRLGTFTLCVLAGLLACAFAQVPSSAPAQGQMDDLKKARQRIAALEKALAASKEPQPVNVAEVPHSSAQEIVRLLNQPIETKGLHERVKLKTALEYLSDKFGGKLPILVNTSGFLAEFGANSDDPYEQEVSLPPVPSKMLMGTALRLILSQIADGKATYIIRDGYIEIVPEAYHTSRYFLHDPSIVATFERRALPEALKELAEKSGATIHLDPNVPKRNDLLVSASFRNVSLEDALVVVTEMTQLKFVVLHRGIYVTTRENAKIIEQEEAARTKTRSTFKRIIGKQRRLEAPAE